MGFELLDISLNLLLEHNFSELSLSKVKRYLGSIEYFSVLHCFIVLIVVESCSETF